MISSTFVPNLISLGDLEGLLIHLKEPLNHLNLLLLARIRWDLLPEFVEYEVHRLDLFATL